MPLVALILLLSLSSASPFVGSGGPEGDLVPDDVAHQQQPEEQQQGGLGRQQHQPEQHSDQVHELQQGGCCYAAGQAVPSGRVPVPRRMAFIIGAQKAGARAGRRAGGGRGTKGGTEGRCEGREEGRGGRRRPAPLRLACGFLHWVYTAQG